METLTVKDRAYYNKRALLDSLLIGLFVIALLSPCLSYGEGPMDLDQDKRFYDDAAAYLLEQQEIAERKKEEIKHLRDVLVNPIDPPDNSLYPESVDFIRNEVPFHDGNSKDDIDIRVDDDHAVHVFDYYINGYSDWAIIGLCSVPGSSLYYPYQEYRHPYEIVELRRDPLGGEYLDNDDQEIQQLFRELLLDGSTPDAENRDKNEEELETEGLHDLGDKQAPVELNRARSLTLEKQPDGSYSMTTDPNERQVAHQEARFKQGDIPDAPPGNPTRNRFREDWLIRKSDSSGGGMKVEYHAMTGKSGHGLWPQAFAGNCHYSTVLEEISPTIHRSDNPQNIDTAKFETFSDLLFAQKMDPLNYYPGLCTAYDIGNDLQMGGALGSPQVADPRFGLLGKLNNGIPLEQWTHSPWPFGGKFGDTLCIPRVGPLFPVTNNIPAPKNFKNAALLRYLRFNEEQWLSNGNGPVEIINTNHRFARFPVGNKPADLIQVHAAMPIVEQNARTTNPALANPPDLLSNLITTYQTGGQVTEYFSPDPDRLVMTVWKYIRCCPEGLEPIVGPVPQLKGKHDFIR